MEHLYPIQPSSSAYLQMLSDINLARTHIRRYTVHLAQLAATVRPVAANLRLGYLNESSVWVYSPQGNR